MKMCAADIQFVLIRSNRKTADIVIERSGDVIVRAPYKIDDDKIRKIVADRQLWVHRSITEWAELNASRIHRPLLQGQSFAYLGRSYRLKFVEDNNVVLRLRDGRWEVSEPFMTEHGEAAVRKAFRDFYIVKRKQIFAERVAHFAHLVDVAPSSIEVKELGFYWASCGTSGALNFNWKTVMAPQTVIDYVTVHELCHLRQRDHSDAFWNEVDKVLPSFRERKEWLRKHGAALDV
jgi:predicted metal-dependent hydrolase